jgi:hypothetical protein
MRGVMDPITEIKRLYHSATRSTIQRDLTRAIILLKSLTTEEERERAAVYMDGLSQMRSEWGVRPAEDARGSSRAKTGKPGPGPRSSARSDPARD